MRNIILTWTLFVLSMQVAVAQVPTGRTSAIDLDFYHEEGTATINLHHKKIYGGHDWSYWHAGTIIAGNHPHSSTDLKPEETADNILIPDNYYTSDNGYNDADWHAKNFYKISDGFVVMDGNLLNGDGSQAFPDARTDNTDIGAAIFRADDKIILGSGFRVLSNPNSIANDIPIDDHNIPTGANSQDCSYFHAYTGDRFANISNQATCSSKVIRLNFTGSTAPNITPFEKMHSLTVNRDCDCGEPENWQFDDDHVNTSYTSAIDGNVLRLFSERKSPCSSTGKYSLQDFYSGGIQTDLLGDIMHCGDTPTQTEYFQGYGKYEVEVKMASGRGAHPAVWSYGGTGSDLLNSDNTSKKTHKYGELDITDACSYWFQNGYWKHWLKDDNSNTSDNPNPSQYGISSRTWIQNKTYFLGCGSMANNIPFIKQAAGRGIAVSYKNPYVTHCDDNGENSFSDCFNILAYEWLPGEVRFLVNGHEVARTTRNVPSTGLMLTITNQICYYGGQPPPFNDLPSSSPASEMLIKNINSDQYDLGVGCKISASPSDNALHSPYSISVVILPPNPNPSDNKNINIEYSIVKETGFGTLIKITLSIFDVLGHEVLKVRNGDYINIGLHKEEIETQAIPSGTYYVRLQVNEQVQTAKLVITH